MFGLLLHWLATREVLRDRERRDDFLRLFNQPDGVEAVEPSGLLIALIRNAVCAQLSRPESARFGETYLRRCEDDVFRAAGAVSFEGTDRDISQAYYLIEFGTHGRTKLLDLLDEDPILLKQVPTRPSDWTEGPLPYGSGNRRTPRRDWFWPIFWIFSLLVLGVLGIMALRA